MVTPDLVLHPALLGQPELPGTLQSSNFLDNSTPQEWKTTTKLQQTFSSVCVYHCLSYYKSQTALRENKWLDQKHMLNVKATALHAPTDGLGR
jgi:hypothetical protein